MPIMETIGFLVIGIILTLVMVTIGFISGKKWLKVLSPLPVIVCSIPFIMVFMIFG
jgi:hypothetical protein